MFFKDFNIGNLLQKIGSLSWLVLSRRSAKKCPLHSIYAGYYFRDLRKYACFSTFRDKWACLIIKTLRNREFKTYWLTLLYTVRYTIGWVHMYSWRGKELNQFCPPSSSDDLCLLFCTNYSSMCRSMTFQKDQHTIFHFDRCKSY